MILYLFFIGLVSLLFVVEYFYKEEGYSYLTVFSILVIILFVVFRHEVGYDYLNYISYFNSSVSSLIERKIELGFVGLVAILKFLGANYFWLFFIIGIAIIAFLFHGIKLYTQNVRIALLIYLLIPGLFLNSLSIIRQSLAIVILFNAYYLFFSKRYLYCFFLIGLGVLFHYSSLLIIPFFFLATKLENRARVLLLTGLPLSLLLAKLNILNVILTAVLGNSKFGVYIGASDETNFIKLLVLNVSVIPYLFFYERLDKLNRTLLILIIFGLILFNVFANVTAISRITYYFKVFEVVLLANLVSFFKRGWSQAIVCICIFIYFFVMFYASLSYDYSSVVEYPKMTPYKTIFSQ